MAPRSIWNGTLALGEIAIPVKLFSVVQEQRIQFREVRLSDGCRVTHQRVGSESGQEIPKDQIRKAYEIGDGDQVVLTDEELATVQGARPKVIQIEQFVPAEQIETVYYDRPYILGAQDGGERAYRLLHAALERSGTVGIGRFALRTREQLAGVAAHGQVLRLYTLRFADELVPAKNLDVPALGRESKSKELQMAERLIDTLATDWEPERHDDHHRQAVMAVIQQKAAGTEIHIQQPAAAKPVPDLLAALEQSVSAGARRKRTSAATKQRRAPAKPPAGSKAKARTR